MSKSEYIFGASWGLIQSDTQLDVGFVDLSARIRQARHVTPSHFTPSCSPCTLPSR